ncbi:MAG: DUF1592 domain-containing protein [Planctomycetia bacterium]|nr:DUF1592 domain-containing protein [Planctomycetia bacterium]
MPDPFRFSLALFTALVCSAARADDAFQSTIQPLLREYCVGCHSTKLQKGELDLEQFKSAADVAKQPKIWEGVLEQLASGEMPPKDQPQLPADRKTKLASWTQAKLDEIALANAGDPGAVVLRRLSNVEYTYSLRDLTGVESLDPAKEFPIDGAAGEGFTNAGAALVMSPALLTKYLDSAKGIAEHAVLLPNGIRFSSTTSPRDWTDESLAKIREFYARFSTTGGASSVNLQGVKFDTNAGGRLPLEKSLAVLLAERTALAGGTKSIADVAREHGLNAKYLGLLWAMLHDTKPSLLLDSLRLKWRAGTLTATDIEAWQQSLWRFASVGHIGKKNGPKGWQEPVNPLGSQHEIRWKPAVPAGGGDLTLYLSAGDAGDGNENDFAVWENARLVAPGRADLPLRDVRAMARRLAQRREAVIASTAKCLAAAAEADASHTRTDTAKLAQTHGVEPELLAGWLDYLGIGSSGSVKLGALLVKKIQASPEYAFVQGWSGADALSVTANSSDVSVRVPGTMKPHGVAAHPSPKLAVVIAWRSPTAATLRIGGSVQDAHPECGNGVTWALEVRRGHSREQLAAGVTKGATLIDMGRFENVRVLPGDVVAVVIGPRDGSHVCDLTAIDLALHDGTREWNLAKDIAPNILAGNPHDDGHGNKDVWHFFGEPPTAGSTSTVPGGSLLAKWRRSEHGAERQRLAQQLEQLLRQGMPAKVLGEADSPDRVLYDQLLAFNGPVLSAALRATEVHSDAGPDSPYGLDPALFGKQMNGKHPGGSSVDPLSLYVKAPAVIEVRLPAALVEGAELVVNGKLHPVDGKEGSVQMQVSTTKPERLSEIAATKAETKSVNGAWSDNNLRTSYGAQVIVNDGSAARQRFEAAFEDFRRLFPAALCYTKIVPVDEVVTLTLFHREDEQLKRLMLDDAQAAELDRLWDDLLFVSEAPLKQVDVFEQLYQFATQDANPAAFEPLREPILRAAEAFKKRGVEVEPKQLQAVLEFAAQSWRRPLTSSELGELRGLYHKLRKQELSHATALRMLIARVIVAPAFLYRGESAAPGLKAAPVNDWELATRLSYFLWSSAPDQELRSLAAAGTLHQPDVLLAQARRMLKDPKARRLATEFGCQWLHVRDLETLDEKSERHFPTFVALRGDMQEEAVRFFMDLFQADRSVLSLLDADHGFINGALAKHYGIDVKSNDWQRVEGLRARGRGGILGFASTLAKQSGASRTSPILRGNWLSEVVLGEKLPRPPKDVPLLPEETPAGLTERQLIERHSSDAKCAVCHKRIDPFGFALEGFDAIGRARDKDSAGLPIDTAAKLANGTQFDGLEGLRKYLLEQRREDFLRQFCRKLLGYALGRSVQLSDKPLLETMLARLKADEYKVGIAIELVVGSPQFREVRGREFVADHSSQ